VRLSIFGPAGRFRESGGGLTLAESERAARHQSHSDRERRTEERKAVEVEKRSEFELETLLAVQAPIVSVARFATQRLFRDIMHFRAGGTVQDLPVDTLEHAEAHRLANAQLSMLSARILDAHVASAVRTFHVAAARLADVTSAAVADQRMDAINSTATSAQEVSAKLSNACTP
jgi:hypothetical protein